MAFEFLINAAASAVTGSLFKGPNKIGGPEDNIFDRFAKDFGTPEIGEIFGAEAQERRDVKAGEQATKEAALVKATGVDIRKPMQLNLQSALIQDNTGQEVLKAVLAGKDIGKLFGGL